MQECVLIFYESVLFIGETPSSKFPCYLRSVSLFERKFKLPVEQLPCKRSYLDMSRNFNAIGGNATPDCVSCENPVIP